MSHPEYNLTKCPECEGDLEPLGLNGDEPIQILKQQCSNCSFDVVQSMLHYPGNRYSVFAPSVDGDTCGVLGCGAEAVTRFQDVREELTVYRCEDCLAAHQQTALEEAEIL